MADVPLFVGGTAEFKPVHCQGDPQIWTAPFGNKRFRGTPIANAKYDGCAPRADFVASEPLFPSVLQRQFNNLKHFKPAVGDMLQLIVVPTNHYLFGVRFDVGDVDPNMAGATVAITGVRRRVDPTDPDNAYIDTEDTFFADAATAQSIADIPLDEPSSTVLWLTKIVGGGATGTIPPGTDSGGGTLQNGASSGFVVPYYVEPELVTVDGVPEFYETGGLILCLKVKSLPSDTNIHLCDMLVDCYMSTIISGFECKSST
jgi:hypothetical protein